MKTSQYSSENIEATRNVPKIYRKALTAVEIGLILEASNNGKSAHEIGKLLGRPAATISQFLRRYKERGTFERKPGSGRKRKTDEFTDHQIANEILGKREMTIKQVQSVLSLFHVSTRTISRRIHEQLHFNRRLAKRKPFISEKNRESRLEWCKQHQNWTSDMWRCVLWSDESPFELRCQVRKSVWRSKDETYENFAMQGTVKHEKKINIWGCFSVHGVGRIYCIAGNLERTQMLKICDECVLPSVDEMQQKLQNGQRVIFQQDNDPKHTAKAVKRWFVDKGIQVLPWPSQSPDLNPIENLWAVLDAKLKDRRPKNEVELFDMIRTGWNHLDKEYFENLVDSMPHRIAAVIANDGKSTKY